MDKPDYARYTEEQLRQVLTRIDADRFPDRVQEIHDRLARMEAERAAAEPAADDTSGDGVPEIAGFWQRSIAYLLDSLLLGLVGVCLGLVLRNQFEAMGTWGRAVGFFVALGYFAVMESRLLHGRTLGKRVMDIKVVARNGAPLSFGRALLRSAVFHLPYFLNGIYSGAGYSAVALPAIQMIIVFGLGGAIVYLYLFNRRTRQSVHDLIVGAVVVRAQPSGPVSLLPVWRGHFVTVVAVFALSIGGVAYIFAAFRVDATSPLLRMQQQVSSMPGVRSASVVEGTAFASGAGRSTFLAIRAVPRSQPGDEKTLAVKIARLVLTAFPAASQMDRFSVTLIHGYDIGIATSWDSKTFNGSPDDWRREQAGNNDTPN